MLVFGPTVWPTMTPRGGTITCSRTASLEVCLSWSPRNRAEYFLFCWLKESAWYDVRLASHLWPVIFIIAVRNTCIGKNVHSRCPYTMICVILREICHFFKCFSSYCTTFFSNRSGGVPCKITAVIYSWAWQLKKVICCRFFNRYFLNAWTGQSASFVTIGSVSHSYYLIFLPGDYFFSLRANLTNSCPLSSGLNANVSLVNCLWFSLPRRPKLIIISSHTFLCKAFGLSIDNTPDSLNRCRSPSEIA